MTTLESTINNKEVILEGDRVKLRYLVVSDVTWLFENITKPEIMNSLHIDKPFVIPSSESEQTMYINNLAEQRAQCSSVSFLVIYKTNEERLGHCRIHNINNANKRAEIGIWFTKENQGKGYGGDAFTLLINYAFDNLELNRLEIRAFESNKHSHRLPERLGFKLEGVLRENHLYKGEFVDDRLYSLLRKDWKY